MTTEFNSEQNLAVCTNEYDSNKEDSIENDEKHIMAVKETEDSFIVQYAKEHDDEEEDMSETAKELIKDFLEVKSDLKAYDDDDENKEYGEFEGYGSVFGNKDFKVEVVEIINGRTSLWGQLIDGRKWK